MQSYIPGEKSLQKKVTVSKKTVLLVLTMFALTFVLIELLYWKPGGEIATFLGLLQIQSPPNTPQQNYAPLQSNQFIDLSINVSFDEPNNPKISLLGKQKGILKSTLSRSIGNYYVELYDDQGKWVDAIFFSVSPTVRVFTKGGEESPEEQEVKEVSKTVRIPYVDSLKKVVIRSVENTSVLQEFPLDVKNDSTISTAAIDTSACNDPYYQGDGQGHFVVQGCANFDKYPAIAGEFKELYIELKENFPELVYFPITEIFLGNNEEVASYCGFEAFGCAYGDGRVALNVFTPFFFKNVGAHELGHILLAYNIQIADMDRNSPSYPALKHLFDEFTAFINSRYGQSRNCEFTYDNSIELNPKYRKQSNNLISEWYAQNSAISPVGFLDCTQYFCPWNTQYNIHPVLKTFEPYSERPKNPGAVTNYGAYNYNEKFAELYASMYKGISGIGIPRSLTDIFKIFDPNQPACSTPGVDCNTDLLKKDVQILGNFCLVEDADHDGVVDSADTCAPKVDCPNNADECYNPSQLTNRGCGLLTQRVYGQDRYQTAIEISKKAFPVNGSAQSVLIASGENYPDAISASLFSFQNNAPILLTKKNDISTDTLTELARVLPAGGKVYVAGGLAVLTDNVVNTIKNYNGNEYQVERIAGPDRFDTALEMAKRISGNPDVFFVTGASDFIDPLAVSALSAQQNIPLLLHPSSATDQRISNFLVTKTVHKIYIIGGYGSVSSAVETELANRFGNVERIYSDQSRYETSLAVAKKFFPQKELNTLMFASGEKFPDGLTSSTFAARSAAPLVLIPSATLPQSDSDFIAEWGSSSSNSVIFGGPAAVDPLSEYDINDAMKR